MLFHQAVEIPPKLPPNTFIYTVYVTRKVDPSDFARVLCSFLFGHTVRLTLMPTRPSAISASTRVFMLTPSTFALACNEAWSERGSRWTNLTGLLSSSLCVGAGICLLISTCAAIQLLKASRQAGKIWKCDQVLVTASSESGAMICP